MQRLVITIARSYGSGGRTLGKKLAAELGIHCYDRELIRMASDESGINEAMFGKVDENIKSLPIFSIAKKNHNGEVFPPDSDQFTSDENLFRYQAKVIRDLADTESCIIIGRAADYILKDRDGVLRLFFYASQENCVKRLMGQEGIGRGEALERIEKIDKYRANYYKYYTGREWYDAHNYDFCIDTAAMSYEKLIAVVKSYIWNRFSGEEKQTAQRQTVQQPQAVRQPAPQQVRQTQATQPVQPVQTVQRTVPQAAVPQRTAPAQVQPSANTIGPAAVPVPAVPVQNDSYAELGVSAETQMRLEAFLDSKSSNEKYQILRAMRDDINDRLIDDMAASIDVVIEGTDTEDRFNKLKNAVAMRSRYELDRHRS